MPTLLFNCGAECGIAAIGAAPGVGGVRHWDVVTGNVLVGTSIVQSGARSYTFSTIANTAYLQKTLLATNFLVGRAYIRFDSLPVANALLIAGTTGGSWPFVAFRASDGTVGLTSSGSLTNFVPAVAVSIDVWYRIDWRFNLVANPWNLQMQVDGANAIQLQPAIAPITMTQFRIGAQVDTTAPPTYTLYVDTIAITSDISFYPLGAGKCVGLFPSGDGAHVFNAAGDFKYNNVTNIAVGATDTWTHVDDPLNNISDFISVNTASITEYLEWLLGDLGSDVGSVNGVQITFASHTVGGTTQNKQTLRLNDGGTLNDVCTDLDQSQSTITYHSKHYNAAPSGGVWTKAKLDALRLRWNSSYGTVDASPVPCMDGVVVEVDYAPSGTAYTLPAATGAFALTGVAAAKKLSFASATGSFASAGNAATQDQTRASSPGAFVLTGNAAVLILTEGGTTDFVLIAASGTFTLTGNAAALKAALKLAAATGSFLLDGKAAGLLAAKRMTGATGVFALTGNAAGLLAARKLIAETGVFVLSGNNAALLKSGSLNLVLVAATGVFALSGKAATLRPFSPFSYHAPEDDTQIYVRDVTADTTLITASATGALLTDAPIKRDTVITPVIASSPDSQFTPV